MYFHPSILTEAQKQQRAAAVSMRSGEIAADVQRQVAALADRLANELPRGEVAVDISAKRAKNGQGKSRRQRVMA